MCDIKSNDSHEPSQLTVPVTEAVGMVLAHDITKIIEKEFKGAAFKKGHVIRSEDICHLQRLGKEHLFILDLGPEEVHEDDAAHLLANALIRDGVQIQGEPKEGKINIVASDDGLLKIDKQSLMAFNMHGEVMCATLHNNTVVRKGQVVAGTRAIPLVVGKSIVDNAVRAAGSGIIEVKGMRSPRVGVVITGNEVFYGRIKDAFAPIIRQKIESVSGEIVGLSYAPDDLSIIEDRLRGLLKAGADLLITTGGMSVDPDDVTRFAIRNLGAEEITYGSAVLPGAMFLSAQVRYGTNGNFRNVPILGIPACGMYAKNTVFDLVLPRILAGEHIGRKELAEFGHGGLCQHCTECRYPVCPMGK
jgi:molybdenum cofactor synthesis domain-containing protein